MRDDRGELAEEKFKALYRTFDKQFFTFKSDGKKAILKVVSNEQAAKLYKEMPYKMFSNTFLFDLTAFKDGLKRDRKISDMKKAIEKESKEAEEKYKKKSSLFVSNSSSLWKIKKQHAR